MDEGCDSILAEGITVQGFENRNNRSEWVSNKVENDPKREEKKGVATNVEKIWIDVRPVDLPIPDRKNRRGAIKFEGEMPKRSYAYDCQWPRKSSPRIIDLSDIWIDKWWL
jgi:hypothetical protein